MQKWEYLILGTKADGTVEYRDLRKHQNYDLPQEWANVTDLLNQFGERGWELVNVESGDGFRFYFKRPKQELP